MCHTGHRLPTSIVIVICWNLIWTKENLDDDVQENVQRLGADREGALGVVSRVDRDVRGSLVQNADVQDQEGGQDQENVQDQEGGRIQLLREARRGLIRCAGDRERGRGDVRVWR